jgi:hypothetical protein
VDAQFTTAPAQRARVRTIAAGDLVALEKETLIAEGAVRAAARRGGAAITRPARMASGWTGG